MMIDSHQKLVLANTAFFSLTGWTSDDLIGKSCATVSEADDQSVAALLSQLAPPPENLASEVRVVRVAVPCRDRAPVPREIHWQPLTEPDGGVACWMGFLRTSPPATSAAPPVPLVQRLHAELFAVRRELRRQYGESSLIGASPVMQQVYRQLRLADPATTVIFQGEPGTGKQHLARALHYRGSTGRRAFVPLVCRDLAPFDVRTLLKQAREAAEVDVPTAPGTLYFQNLEDLSRDLQDSLLEWLTSPPPRLRFFFGSRLPLSALRELDRFVEGFWLAISDLVIEVPPLSLRGDDLGLLAQYFVEEWNRGRDAAEGLDGIDPQTLERLKEHDWPGNVRQLQTVIRDSAEQATGKILTPDDLSFGFQAATSARASATPHRDALLPLDELLAKVEREQIEAALQAARGNKSKAADLLGVTRPRLYRRLTELGILADDATDVPTKSDCSDSVAD